MPRIKESHEASCMLRTDDPDTVLQPPTGLLQCCSYGGLSFRFSGSPVTWKSRDRISDCDCRKCFCVLSCNISASLVIKSGPIPQDAAMCWHSVIAAFYKHFLFYCFIFHVSFNSQQYSASKSTHCIPTAITK